MSISATGLAGNEIALLVTTAVVGGVVAIGVKYVQDAIASRTRLLILQEIDLCNKLLKELDPGSIGAITIQDERHELLERVRTMSARRPIRRSIWSYTAGLALVVGPLGLVYYLIFGQLVLDTPWLLIPLMLTSAVIYAIESQPRFLRPLVWRLRPQRRPVRPGLNNEKQGG